LEGARHQHERARRAAARPAGREGIHLARLRL